MSSRPARPMRADAQRNRERILAAAEQVFAEGGPDASTERVARQAGVAIGTVFRHFPTKADLLRALMKRLLNQITADAARLLANGEEATALFELFGTLVARTATNRTVVALLPAEGLGTSISGPLGTLRDAISELLARGQRAGTIRAEVRADEVMALLEGACAGALQGNWDSDLRDRALAIMFAGLGRPRA